MRNINAIILSSIALVLALIIASSLIAGVSRVPASSAKQLADISMKLTVRQQTDVEACADNVWAIGAEHPDVELEITLNCAKIVLAQTK
jgi:hypothetical protein